VSDPLELPAVELAAEIRARRVGCRELLEHALARVAGVGRELNAVVTLDAERARRRADEADAALARGEVRGPLHGLPITVKDTFQTEGLRTTSGFAPFDHVPARSAVAVERLAAAGAIVFGKSNCPPLAADFQSYNDLFGVSANPWDRSRTPGGSSGGSAAAVAAGLTAFELGSDIGGSIRVPAHWCGVYGHKPTHGIVPVRGHVPGPPGTLAEPDLAVVGPLARSADDLALLLDVLAGPGEDRSVGWRLALPPPRRSTLGGYRAAAWLDDADFPVDRQVSELLARAVEELARAGVAVDDRARPGLPLRDWVELYDELLYPIVAGNTAEEFEALRKVAAAAAPSDRSEMARMARAATAPHKQWLAAHERREALRARMADLFREFDVLLMPVCAVPAIPHDHSQPMFARTVRVNGAERSYLELFAWIVPPTTAWLPATSAPIGLTRDGLPVGIQIVGPYLEDRTAIDFARRLAERIGGYTPPR
jgi:amidase